MSKETHMQMTITADGVEYPCRPSMGAMLRFKRETGKEIHEITGTTDLLIYLWCCVCSACAREGREFNMSLMEFSDRVGLDDMAAWQSAISGDGEAEESGGDSKKKQQG